MVPPDSLRLVLWAPYVKQPDESFVASIVERSTPHCCESRLLPPISADGRELREAVSAHRDRVCAVVVIPDESFLMTSSTEPPTSPLSAMLRQFVADYAAIFTIVFGEPFSTQPFSRFHLCSDCGVGMVSHVSSQLMHILSRLGSESRAGKLTCPVCRKDKLTAEELWYHLPQYHVNCKKTLSMNRFPCPICSADDRSTSLVVHVHDHHPPPGMVGCDSEERSMLPMVAFGLCVIQRKRDGKFLVVQEYENQGYWLPGGGIEAGEMPDKAAARECLEEAGVPVQLTGLLRVEVNPSHRYVRVRYIFYGHPVNEDDQCKTFPDFESVGACWVGVDDLQRKDIRWRGSEPFHWFGYVAKGGIVPPISMLTREGAPPVVAPLAPTVSNK